MIELSVRPGQKITLDVTGRVWPFYIGVGSDFDAAWPDRVRDELQGTVKTIAWRRCPTNLGAGRHPLTVRDADNDTLVGYVTIQP